MDSDDPRDIVSPTTPSIVGLYGIPGCGKSFLMQKLKEDVGDEKFSYFEGSDIIDSVTPGGLSAFKGLETSQQTHFRQLAINTIRAKCAESGKVGIVTGHFMFWAEEDSEGTKVCSEDDLKTYTHIFYVNTPMEQTIKQRLNDTKRSRPDTSFQHLSAWQASELSEMRQLCRENNILFACIYPNIREKMSMLLLDIERHNEDHNTHVAEESLDKALAPGYDKLQTVVLLDGDRTLNEEDTGKLFWKAVNKQDSEVKSPLKALFGSQMGYSYAAFRQAMLLYEESVNDAKFEELCEEVCLQTSVYPQMSAFLHQVTGHRHVCAIVVTCGLRLIWQKLIAREGLSGLVQVIGGGRLKEGYVITPKVKKLLVSRVKNIHETRTWVFGDSPLDLPMLLEADHAIVVVGEQTNRSKTMDDELFSAMLNRGLKARQVLLPNQLTTPRIDTIQIPAIDISSAEFLTSVVRHRGPVGGLNLIHATESTAAKLLMTPMRDATVKGPMLREAHFKAGAHLARIFLSEYIGLEEVKARHVQGNVTTGYQLRGEERTLVVPLMRGGESMAFGISDVFPKSKFLHATKPEDIDRTKHLEGAVTVILVDSVINSGSTIVQFVKFIRNIHATIRIIVVAGVVQDKAVTGCSPIRALARSAELTVIALRLSKNKYTGKGGTDTGNRLFNTTHLE